MMEQRHKVLWVSEDHEGFGLERRETKTLKVLYLVTREAIFII